MIWVFSVPNTKIWRDAKLCAIGEDTSEIQRLVYCKTIAQSINTPTNIKFERRALKKARLFYVKFVKHFLVVCCTDETSVLSFSLSSKIIQKKEKNL